MPSSELIYLIGLCAALLIPVVLIVVKYLRDYSARIRETQAHLDNAKSWRETVYWSHELRYLRWSVIPGMTPARARRFAQLFYSGKYEKEEQSDGLISMLMPSVVGMLMCCVCLVSVTLAWFSADVRSQPVSLTAANFELAYNVTQVGGASVDSGDGTYTLAEGEYTVTLTPSGTASGGYCIVTVNGEKHYTERIENTTAARAAGSPFTFTIKVTGGSITCSFEAVWGTYSGTDESKIINTGEILEVSAPTPANAEPPVVADPPIVDEPGVIDPPAPPVAQVPPATEAPAVPPATEAPAVPPATEAPAVPPATEAPEVPPVTEAPAVPPVVTEAPTDPPATEAVPPATEEPTETPTEAPTDPPATEEPASEPTTGEDATPAEPTTDTPPAEGTDEAPAGNRNKLHTACLWQAVFPGEKGNSTGSREDFSLLYCGGSNSFPENTVSRLQKSSPDGIIPIKNLIRRPAQLWLLRLLRTARPTWARQLPTSTRSA